MRVRTACLAATAAACLWGASGPAWAMERFPPPDFDSGYTIPPMVVPDARTGAADWLDVALYGAALVLMTWLVLYRRSRNSVSVLSVAALAYFGFYRQGCVCPIGAIQNVALGLASSEYALPLTVIVIFALPVVFSLFFGRVFCGGVCPLGAIQDVVLVRAVRVPRPLAAALGVLPYVYLGAAVLLAATDALFFICRYDPFVGFFRLTGSFGMLVYGGILLALAMVVSRPYCRFLCPYGALLSLCSRLAWRGVSVTPDQCIACTLCKDVCPVDAIQPVDPAEAEAAR
jgi:NosR/NirI family transcriptional regulator, nitrous oxide reductase regulator